MKKILLALPFIFTLGAGAQGVTVKTQPSLTSGWIKVYDNGHIGYLNEEGDEVIPPVYDEIGRFGDYCGNAALVKKDGLYGLIDNDGSEFVSAQYESIGPQGEYNPEWILVKKDGLYGFIDCSGEEIVEPVYTEIEAKSDKAKLN